jgi:K+-transporting ATPase ATPase A chain
MQSVSILVTMPIGFEIMLAIGLSIQSGPALLETRFGSFGSVFFDLSSTSSNTGALNPALAGLSPSAVTSAYQELLELG